MKFYLLYSHGMHHLVFDGRKTGFQILGSAILMSEIIDKMKTAGIVKQCFGPNQENLEYHNSAAQIWLHLELENKWKHYENSRTKSLLIPEELMDYVKISKP